MEQADVGPQETCIHVLMHIHILTEVCDQMRVTVICTQGHTGVHMFVCNYEKVMADMWSTSEVNDGTNSQGTIGTKPTTNEVKTMDHIVTPYTQGLCESIKKICGRYGIQTHFKGSSTITNLLVSPKDKDPIVNKSGAIYWFQCGDLPCNDEYIGEISRTFGERFKEHLKDPSPVHYHSSNTGHPITQ